MPRVPIYNERQVAPRPIGEQRLDESASPAAFGAGLGRAAQQAAGVFADVQRVETEKAERVALSEAEDGLKVFENSAVFDAENGAFSKKGKDAFGLPGQVLPGFDETASRIERGLGSERLKLAFREVIRNRRSMVERELDRHELSERDRYYDEQAVASIALSVESAANYAGNAERVAREIVQQREVLADRAQRLGLSPQAAEQQRFTAESKTHQAVANALISRGSFNAASEYIVTNAPRMADSDLESAQRRLLIEEERAFDRATRERKLTQDGASKEGDRLDAQGDLGSEWIEANRERLSSEDYRYFYRRLRGEGSSGPRDLDLYADLRLRAGRGEDVSDQARAALHAGQIDSPSYDRILGETEQQWPGFYTRGVRFIETAAAPSAFSMDPAPKARMALMLEDWSEWARQNPKATDEQARETYMRIVQNRSLVDLLDLARTTGLKAREMADIDAQEQALVTELDTGRINQAEFNRRAVALNELRRRYELAHPVSK